MILFKDEGHEYSLQGERLTSVSKFFSNFQEKFDSINQSFISAGWKVDYKNINSSMYKARGDVSAAVEELKNILSSDVYEDILERSVALRNEWNQKGIDASSRGTAFHLKRELEDYELGGRKNPWDDKFYPVFKKEELEGVDNYQITEDLYDLEDGYYPELLIGNKELKVVGQADMVFIETVGNVRYVDIDDWKVLEKVSFEGYPNRFAGGVTKKLLGPLSHLQDCNFSVYMIKICVYAYLLELYGFVPRNLGFSHVTVDENLEIIERVMYAFPYKRREVIDMFLAYKR